MPGPFRRLGHWTGFHTRVATPVVTRCHLAQILWYKEDICASSNQVTYSLLASSMAQGLWHQNPEKKDFRRVEDRTPGLAFVKMSQIPLS